MAAAVILHGRRDEVAPLHMGQQLHRLLPNSQLVVLDCGHWDLMKGQRHAGAAPPPLPFYAL